MAWVRLASASTAPVRGLRPDQLAARALGGSEPAMGELEGGRSQVRGARGSERLRACASRDEVERGGHEP